MSGVIRIPISPSANYLNRTVLLRSSLDRVGGTTADMPLEVFVSPDRERPPSEWRAHVESLGIRWCDVDENEFTTHSYAAATHLRMKEPTEHDVIVLADADLVVVGPISDAVDECARTNCALGVTAYRSPFTQQAYDLRSTSSRRDCWTDLFERLNLPAPAFTARHPSGYEQDWEDDVTSCPPYYNFGMVYLRSETAVAVSTAHAEEVIRVREVFDGAHDAQLALSCALARLDIDARELPLRFNFPNQRRYVAPYGDEAADIRVLHYMSRERFDKERDLDSTPPPRSLAADGTWRPPPRPAPRRDRCGAGPAGRLPLELTVTVDPIDTASADHGPVGWVEEKEPHWDVVRALLSESTAQNQWSNFGPVSSALERRVADVLGLRDDRAVIATSSGTAALEAISAIEEYRLGRPTRWVVSDFGFHCTHQGAFRHAVVVDCDTDGIIDLDRVREIDRDDYDAVLVTNPFGVLTDFDPFTAFGDETGKLVVADSAGAFDAAHAPGKPTPTEALSFHHTKPWGFGEGGAMIVADRDEAIARSVINFGLVADVPITGGASNGKMSDIAAAFILAWLEGVEELREATTTQFERIAAIARSRSWEVLGDSLEGARVRSCVPLIWRTPVSLDGTAKSFITRRYYQPLVGLPTANLLYRSIVNVPCHRGMAAVTDEQIAAQLESIERND